MRSAHTQNSPYIVTLSCTPISLYNVCVSVCVCVCVGGGGGYVCMHACILHSYAWTLVDAYIIC